MVMMLGAQFPICSYDHASDGFVQSPERAVTSMCANWKASDWSRKKRRKKIPPVSPGLLQKQGAAEQGERRNRVSTQQAGVTINGSCNKL